MEQRRNGRVSPFGASGRHAADTTDARGASRHSHTISRWRPSSSSSAIHPPYTARSALTSGRRDTAHAFLKINFLGSSSLLPAPPTADIKILAREAPHHVAIFMLGGLGLGWPGPRGSNAPLCPRGGEPPRRPPLQQLQTFFITSKNIPSVCGTTRLGVVWWRQPRLPPAARASPRPPAPLLSRWQRPRRRITPVGLGGGALGQPGLKTMQGSRDASSSPSSSGEAEPK